MSMSRERLEFTGAQSYGWALGTCLLQGKLLSSGTHVSCSELSCMWEAIDSLEEQFLAN